VFGVLVGWLQDNWKQIAFDLVDALLGVLIKIGEIARSIGGAIWNGIKAGLSGGDFDMTSIVNNILDSFDAGMEAKGTLGERLGQLAFKDMKPMMSGFNRLSAEMPDFKLADSVAPALKVKSAIEGAAAAQGEMATSAKKTADSLQEAWKGAGAATENSVEAAKSIARFLGMKRDLVKAPVGPVASAVPNPYATTQDFSRIGTDIAGQALNGGPAVSTPAYMPNTQESPQGAMVLQEAMLGELTAMRSALEGINSTIVSEPAVA
jgi:hypothetical protein